VANDQGFPPKYGRILVTINVDRDRSRPIFQRTEVNVTIDERLGVDRFVTSVSATDADIRQVSRVILFVLITEVSEISFESHAKTTSKL
jgi:hypothetical protein